MYSCTLVCSCGWKTWLGLARVWGENWRWCATRSQQESGQGRDWPQWRPQATCRCQCHSFLAPVQNRPARGQHGNISPPACKHPDHQGPAPHTQNLEIYRSQSCTSVHIRVNSLSNSCYYNPHRQITNCWITSLAILWPVSASLHRPLPRRKHWNTWDRTVALSPPSPWLRTWAILWPAGDQPLSLIQNYSNISKYVSTCLNNLQKQYFFFILLCPLADVSSGLTSDGKSADWDNSCRTKQDVPQKTSTANTCIQLHFCLVLAKMLGRVWPCFVFGLVGFGGLCTFLPCFLTPHGRSSGDFAFGSGSRRFPACHSGRPEPNQLRSSPLESYMGNLMFSSIVYSNIF